jgi:Fur family transcriptional regulator, ferric uptake regulator
LTRNLSTILKQKGYKLTPQRRAVINAIAKSNNHVTPAELYEQAHSEHPGVGLVTVYRTLKMLSGMGLICELHGEGHSRSYLLRRPAEHHHHLVCSGCGFVVDFASCALNDLERRLIDSTGFVMEDHLLEFHGRCPQCQKVK